MPFDGSIVKALVHELNNKIVGGKIDKIYQPEKDEIVISIRSYKEGNKLLISASSTYPRINLTTESKANPQVPPSFCMLLRKYLTGGRIVSISQPSMERIIKIHIDCVDELGYSNQKTIIAEIMGRNSNIILVDEKSNKIIDSIKHIDEQISSIREVLPGLQYEYPPSDEKLDPLSIDRVTFEGCISLLSAPIKIEKFLLKTFFGISPAFAKEVCYISEVDGDTDIRELSQNDVIKLYDAFRLLIGMLLDNKYCPTLYADNNELYDFSSIMLSQYNSFSQQHLDSMSSVIEQYYSERDNRDRIRQKTGDIRRLLSNKLERCYKKLEILNNELSQSKNSDKYRIFGDLLTSNMHLMKKSESKIRLLNYYSENEEYIDIPLDLQLTPSQNAQRYYKLYNKSKNAIIMIEKQLQDNRDEIIYLESQLDNLEKCTEEIEVNEIKDELADLGYFKKRKPQKQKNQKSSSPLQFMSSKGFEIYVGKNNVQNDYLTLKVAGPQDIWLHTKDIPGSHVIIKINGRELDDSTLLEAANLAAFYSKGKMSSKVPVDYAPRKNVKKPSRAKPGMVIYDNYKTVYVNPDDNAIKRLNKNS